MGMRLSLIFLCGLLCLSSVADAQPKDPHADDPISVVVEPVQFPPRTGTFYPVTCTITNRTSGLWEGSLRLRQVEALPTDFELIIPDLVVGSEPLEFSISLPPIVPNRTNQQTELDAHSIDKNGHVEELPKVQLLSYMSDIRMMTFGICTQEGVTGNPGDVEPLIESLQLFEKGTFQSEGGRTIRVSAPTVISTELSEQPLAYIRFDGLLLSKMALELLRPKQCAAIETWVRAGGSLAINLPDNVDAEHLEFLNRLISEGQTKLELDPDRGLISEPKFDQPLPVSSGLGQVTLIPKNYITERGSDKEELNRLSWMLWRTIPEFVNRINSFTTDRVRLEYQLNQTQLQMQARRLGQRISSASVLSQESSSQLDALFFDLLKPRNMGVIPIQFLILSLVVYVLLIGPGDYYVLGWFKARRFTWILFPLLTICFSWGMLRLTNYVMGTNDRLSKIRIVDLDQSGKVLRENEISLLMYSTPKRERLDVAGGLVTRLQNTPFGVDRPGVDSRRWDRSRPTYVGRIPTRYEVQIDAEQWNPERYRTVKFGSTSPMPEFPWEKYVREKLVKLTGESAELKQEFQQDLSKAFGESAQAVIYKGDAWSDLSPINYLEKGKHLERRALMELSSMKPGGEFSWLRRVSPLCTESFDDLAILEALDNKHWVLGILMHEGEDLTLYRMLILRQEGDNKQTGVLSEENLPGADSIKVSPKPVPNSNFDP